MAEAVAEAIAANERNLFRYMAAMGAKAGDALRDTGGTLSLYTGVPTPSILSNGPYRRRFDSGETAARAPSPHDEGHAMRSRNATFPPRPQEWGQRSPPQEARVMR